MTGSAENQAFVRELLGRSDYAIIGENCGAEDQGADLGCGEANCCSGWRKTRGGWARRGDLGS